MTSTGRVAWPRPELLAGWLLVGLMIGFASITRGAEIIPSVGISRSARAGGSDQAAISGGVAVRGDLLPMLKSEVGVAYRSESRQGGQLKMKMWPVTASLWLTPVPALYAGGGVGWYHTSFDYDSSLPVADETHQSFGVHLGGGLRVPLASAAALDLGGRYVFMHEQESRLVPSTFDPDFWTTTVGLAIKF